MNRLTKAEVLKSEIEALLLANKMGTLSSTNMYFLIAAILKDSHELASNIIDLEKRKAS